MTSPILAHSIATIFAPSVYARSSLLPQKSSTLIGRDEIKGGKDNTQCCCIVESRFEDFGDEFSRVVTVSCAGDCFLALHCPDWRENTTEGLEKGQEGESYTLPCARQCEKVTRAVQWRHQHAHETIEPKCCLKISENAARTHKCKTVESDTDSNWLLLTFLRACQIHERETTRNCLHNYHSLYVIIY